MLENIFIPKYPSRLYFGFILVIAMELFVLWQRITGEETSRESIFVMIFFAAMIVFMTSAYIKRLVFTKSGFSVEKFLWPTKTIPYTDVVSIGTSTIRTRNGNLAIQFMRNSKELRHILSERMKPGRDNSDQIENKEPEQK